MSNNWQKDIHDRMGNYEIDAPEGLWDNISKEISSKGIGPKSMGEANGDNKQTTKGATIFQHRFQRAVGIAVAACLAFVVGFYFYNSDDTTPTLADNSASQKTVTKQQYSSQISDNKDLDIDNNSSIGKDTEDNTIKNTQKLLAAHGEVNGDANAEHRTSLPIIAIRTSSNNEVANRTRVYRCASNARSACSDLPFRCTAVGFAHIVEIFFSPEVLIILVVGRFLLTFGFRLLFVGSCCGNIVVACCAL